MQARLSRPHPAHHLVDFDRPPGEPGILVVLCAAPRGQQQVLHHPFRRARVIQRVREHPPGAAPAQEIRRLDAAVPVLEHRITQIISADEDTVRGPAHPQLGHIRASLQQLEQPLAEEPIPRRLRREAGRQHSHPDVLSRRRSQSQKPGGHVARWHGLARKACVDNDEELGGTGLGASRSDVTRGPQPVRGETSAIPGQQAQAIRRRRDRVAAPQQHQRTAIR